MASVYKELLINAPIDRVWDAVQDYGALHTRLVIGFVTDCKVDGDDRVVTFFNGNVVRERLVGIDVEHKRLSYTLVGSQATHHQASVALVAEADHRTRFIWITDVLPNALAETIDAMMARGLASIRQTLER